MNLIQPFSLDKRIRNILGLLIILNAAAMVLLARDVRPENTFTFRIIAGTFLLLFVCIHGWFQYGWPSMTAFFCITAAITWVVESLSVKTGIPFGFFSYAETLGVKIGDVPLMILPAYFFNGYLAWIMACLLVGTEQRLFDRRQIIQVPFLAALLMVMWNLSFEPVMSTIEGHWQWQSGDWHGVPLTNYAGWLLTSFLFFLAFSILLKKYGEKLDARRVNILPHNHWYLIPVMYAVQSLPGLLHLLFRDGHEEIYRSVAMLTAFTVLPAAALTVIQVRRRRSRQAARKNEGGSS